VYKVIVTLKRNSKVSSEQFQEYYEHKHVAAAEKAFGKHFAGYRRNYVTRQFLPINGALEEIKDADGIHEGTYDVLSEFWFKDKESMEMAFEAFATRDRKTEIEDERYLDMNSIRVLIVHEAVSKLPA
jgi:hypothetical protein